jgi:hypothetical protein
VADLACTHVSTCRKMELEMLGNLDFCYLHAEGKMPSQHPTDGKVWISFSGAASSCGFREREQTEKAC